MSDENERTPRKIPPPPEPTPAPHPPSIYWSDTAYKPATWSQAFNAGLKPFGWLIAHKHLYGWFIFLIALGTVTAIESGDAVRIGIASYALALNSYLFYKRHVEKRKRKNSTGDTNNPFHPEYWRDDVPPPHANPGYFEATK